MSSPSAHPGEHRSIAEHLTAVHELLHDATSRTPRSTERAAVSAALAGRVVAQDVYSQLAVPSFSHSAMDGFLVHAADAVPGATLPVSGDVPAGAAPQSVPAGTAVRIMTGAPVGDPVDPGLRVIPVEDTSIPPGPHPLPEYVTLNSAKKDRPHIRHRGENLADGSLLLPRGHTLDPAAIAALLSAGIRDVDLAAPLKIAVVSSGDELVPFDAEGLATTTAGALGTRPEQLPPGHIPDSNRPMLAALVAQVVGPAAAVSQYHCADDTTMLANLLQDLADNTDLIITAGGVSAGAFDVVRAAVGELASAQLATAWFGEVAQKPGAPQGLGQVRSTPLMCLPGNPVAAFVAFHLYVSPALRHLTTGSVEQRALLRMPAGADFPVPRPGNRDLVVPVRWGLDAAGRAQAIPYNGPHLGSHLVASLLGTRGLVRVPAGATAPAHGELVEVIPFLSPIPDTWRFPQ